MRPPDSNGLREGVVRVVDGSKPPVIISKSMRVDLKIPESQVRAARKRGAKWDDDRKVWYVKDLADLSFFLKWMPAHLTRPHKPQ